MKITSAPVTQGTGIRFSLMDDQNIECGHAYLYVLYNDIHSEPFGFIEDVFVEPDNQGKGYGTQLVERLIEEAQNQGCYKLIGTSRESRPKVHEFYQKLGFELYGREFRMNVTKE